MLVHTSLLLFIIVTEHVFTSSKEAEAASGADLSAALTQQMEEHRKEHQKHLNSLRDELDAKQEVIDSLKEYVIPYRMRISSYRWESAASPLYLVLFGIITSS